MEKNIYRIIDVNFNRGREAARMVEEFCRFTLNSQALSSRAKQIRHQLCTAIGKLDTDKLLINRDSQADVGRGMIVEDQLKRCDIKDCFVAASKRLTEALRVLAEVTQTVEPACAGIFENLRFEAYSLEKDIFLESRTKEKFKNVRLYVLITVRGGDKVENISKLARQCISGGADCIQIRAKWLDDIDILEISKAVVDLCSQAKVLSIVNDRVDIASLSGADGVHLGQGDLTIEHARKLQTSPLVIGRSTHSVEQLKEAIASGADYVGIGPAFETATKPHEKVTGMGYIMHALEALSGSEIGYTAIGGITLENLDQVLLSGVRTVAVCSAVTEAKDPEEACRQFKKQILAFS